MIFKGYIYINISHPLVCWEIYRGALISADKTENLEQKHPSIWLASKIRRSNNVSISNELLFEAIREKYHPDKVSRLRGIYVFKELDSAQYALDWGGYFVFDNLVEAEIITDNDLTKLDANWLTHANYDTDGYINESNLDNIKKYWEGIPYNDQPCWEYLISGRAIIMGTRIRQKAYDLLKKNMPDCLGLLELSRVALTLNSDLGHIIPYIRKNSDDIFHLNYYLDFADAKNKHFLDKLKEYEGPKNIIDLNASSNLVTPDLSRFACEFKISKENLHGYSTMKVQVY